MEWFIIAAAFAGAAYLIYRSRKAKKGGGSFRDSKGNEQQR